MEFTFQTHRVYILAIIALLLLVGVGWNSWRYFQKTRHQRHVKSIIESLGLTFIRDAVLPDGLDGLVFIDYLLLVPGGAIVLDVENSEGHLFGGESVDQWTQVVKNHTYKFHNPLYANQTKCQAVMWNVENFQEQHQDGGKNTDWQTQGWVVFSNAGNFPKGIPNQVSMIDTLADKIIPLTQQTGDISPYTRELWNQLHDLSVTTRAELSK